mmetsp:Transcript_24187/g.72708  ORF Transcript_24187/g.72708 Transcript_24187/m.72708 type:complete len:182 (+) Transcript_24187:234-779(+)
MGYPAPASSRAPQLLAVCVAVLAALAIYGKTDAPVATGRDNAATAALRASADLFKQTKRRGRPTGIVAEPLLQASAALLPAFDSTTGRVGTKLRGVPSRRASLCAQRGAGVFLYILSKFWRNSARAPSRPSSRVARPSRGRRRPSRRSPARSTRSSVEVLSGGESRRRRGHDVDIPWMPPK